MNKLNINNVFGIKPTNTHMSAGMDFYIPIITSKHDDKEIRSAFCKSYKLTNIDLDMLLNIFHEKLTTLVFAEHKYNILHLYLALYSHTIEYTKQKDLSQAIQIFINDYLCFDANNMPGISLRLNDTLLINSGIRVALPPEHAGIFFNKSGKGNEGYDIRACVVDEDYAGYVHMSVAMTKQYSTHCKGNTIYCGDKLTQMVVLPVVHCEINEIGPEEYSSIMSNSQRGSNAFGSSDVVH